MVGVWRDTVATGDILSLEGVDADWRVEGLGDGAVGGSVHGGPVIVLRLVHDLDSVTVIYCT